MPSEAIDDWNKFLMRRRKSFFDRYSGHFQSNMRLDDLKILKTIGEGSYGTVVVARTPAGGVHAVKILPKFQIVLKHHVKQVLEEKRILSAVRFPFIIHITHFFQDNSYIYFVMPFMAGGELFVYLRQVRRFDERKAAFYAAQVVLALEYLHNLSVAYRDLKPENLVFGADGYIKITDLGFAKRVESRTYTLCGTPDYLAPEVFLSRGYGLGVDWWALGVLVYEMCAGLPPFYSPHVTGTLELIASRAYNCPPFFSPYLKDLLDRLFQMDSTRRLGCLKSGPGDVKSHDWFRKISWMDVLNKKVAAPYKPVLRNDCDTGNFMEYNDFKPRVTAKDDFQDLFAEF